MKYLILLLVMVFTSPIVHAQKKREFDGATVYALPVDPESHLVAYTGVVEVLGTTQAQLYSRAYEWVAKNYNSAQAAIQMQDKEAGKIIVQSHTTAYFKGHEFGWITHTLSLYLKDGKYKYDITSFRHESPTHSYGNFEQAEPTYIPGAFKGAAKTAWNEMKASTDTEMKATIASLQATMSTKSKGDF